MPRIYYRGKLSPFIKMGLISNNFMAWMMGRLKDRDAMRKKMRDGYEGVFSDDVSRYDKLTRDHYTEIGEYLLKEICVTDKNVLEIGCGTGIISKSLLEKGVGNLVCVDYSRHMLDQCRTKLEGTGLPSDNVEYKLADAENLPFEDNTFDTVVSSMVLGLVVDQEKVLSEIYRVLKPGGELALSTHGPEWYCEFTEYYSRCLLGKYPLSVLATTNGSLFWPVTRAMFQKMLGETGFENISVKNQKDRLQFASGEDTYMFVAAAGAGWFLCDFLLDEREQASEAIKNYFGEKNVKTLTSDALMGYGQKR